MNNIEPSDDMLINPVNKKLIRNEDFILGMSKGLALLDSFGTDKHRLNITMAAERTGMTRAAARRHLLTLEYLGYVESDGHFFYLTPKVLKLSGAYLGGAILPKISQPLLNLLTSRTSLIYSLVVLDTTEAITIARSTAQLNGERMNPYGLYLGNRLPAHATSAGKVLLAHLSSEARFEWIERYQLKKMTRYTCTEPNVFLELLDDVAEKGWCYSSEEHELGVHALAVPVFNQKGEILSALNIVSSTSKTTKLFLLQKILPELQQTAHELRNTL